MEWLKVNGDNEVLQNKIGEYEKNDKIHIYIFLTYPDHFSTILS